MFYSNVASLLGHIEELHEFLMREKPLVLLTCSTGLTNEINDNEIECEGYTFHRNDSHSRHTGGCCFFVRSDLRSEVVNASCLDEKVWILSIRVHNGTNDYICTAVYFSPNGGKKDFNEWCDSNIHL